MSFIRVFRPVLIVALAASALFVAGCGTAKPVPHGPPPAHRSSPSTTAPTARPFTLLSATNSR